MKKAVELVYLTHIEGANLNAAGTEGVISVLKKITDIDGQEYIIVKEKDIILIAAVPLLSILLNACTPGLWLPAMLSALRFPRLLLPMQKKFALYPHDEQSPAP